MPLFDRYIAVDWSANSRPKGGKDSIWIAEHSAGKIADSVNPRTRHVAMEHLEQRLQLARSAGQRTFVGFDFPFGYPKGTAQRLTGEHGWAPLWTAIGVAVRDADDNQSNRFDVAAGFNQLLGEGGPRFWGCPASAATEFLSTHKHGAVFGDIAEFRIVETVAKGAKSTWQLFYNGSVGSQCILGLARLQGLRGNHPLAASIAIWPFETDFERNLGSPIVFAEIYPSLDDYDTAIKPKDRAQVEAQVRRFAALDAAGQISRALSLPNSFAAHRDIIVAEEGWIVGAGHSGLLS
jgi:precorrin-8X/cobalt-precorrin-8 methylmutase